MEGAFRTDKSPQLARIGLPRSKGYQALNNILKSIRRDESKSFSILRS